MTNLDDRGLGSALSDGKTLFSFLGQFWHGVYADPDFIERFCDSLGLLSAQLEQKKNEAKAASGRLLLPVCSRERWFRVVLSGLNRNTGDASKVELSSTSDILVGCDNRVGEGGLLDGASRYSLPKSVVSAESAHEGAFDPEVSLVCGSDFSVSDGSIVFSEGKDPV